MAHTAFHKTGSSELKLGIKGSAITNRDIRPGTIDLLVCPSVDSSHGSIMAPAKPNQKNLSFYFFIVSRLKHILRDPGYQVIASVSPRQ